MVVAVPGVEADGVVQPVVAARFRVVKGPGELLFREPAQEPHPLAVQGVDDGKGMEMAFAL